MEFGNDVKSHFQNEKDNLKRTIGNTTATNNRKFQETKLKLARSMKSLARDCENDCGFGELPFSLLFVRLFVCFYNNEHKKNKGINTIDIKDK